MSNHPGGPRTDPSIRPTSISVLVVSALAAGAVACFLLSIFYADWPPLPWLPVIVIAALAVMALVGRRRQAKALAARRSG